MTMFTEAVDALTGARRREADEFAALLEGGRQRAGTVSPELDTLAGLARALVPAQHSPAPAFRDELRARLVAEAAAREPVAPVVPAPRTGERSHQGVARWRTAVATVAVASVVTGAGAAAASTHALPGDALYGLKLRIESVQLALAGSDLERGRELLEQADHRLGEVERLAASSTAAQPETRRDLGVTLTEMQDATTAGAAALTASYEDTGDEEPMLLLDRFVTDQQQRLRDLMGLLDPALRARLLSAVDEADAISGRASALLGPASASDSARQDGWETAKLADRAGSAGGSRTDSGSESGSGSGSTGSDSDPVGDVVGGLEDTAGSAAGSSGSGPGSGTPSTGSGGVNVDVPDVAGSATAVPLPVPSVPLPAPVSSAVPTALPTVAVTVPPVPVTPSATLPVPLPSCVAVPPLTTC